MKQSHNGFAPEEGPQERFDWHAHQQELRHNVQNLKKTTEKAGAMVQDFEQLAHGARLNIAATYALQRDINELAKRLGLSPISSERIQSLKMSTDGI